MNRTLASLAQALSAGKVTSRTLVEQCLDRIADPNGEGARTFLKVSRDFALAAADFHDSTRGIGAACSQYAGIPISIKDLFDVAGDVTTAGSRVLRNAPAAQRDATSVARLRASGFVIIGRTNMTEFAYSGLGLNPHYGTPANPFERSAPRIPGGSSSGAAVSISDEMAYGALGTDTGGSCRIPAAFCGIVGFKPTARRVPLRGTFMLSQSLDSIGPLAASVRCCATLDAILADESAPALQPAAVGGLRLAVLRDIVFDGIEPAVAAAFSRAVDLMSRAGVRVNDVALPDLKRLTDINSKGGFAAAESYALHRQRLQRDTDEYDPRVANRILRGQTQDAADYLSLLTARTQMQDAVLPRMAEFDALLMPTTPICAPRFADVQSDADYHRLNLLALRNPAIANFLDCCAISIPCNDAGSAPVGLMLMGSPGCDRRLLTIAAAIEDLLRPSLAQQ